MLGGSQYGGLYTIINGLDNAARLCRIRWYAEVYHVPSKMNFLIRILNDAARLRHPNEKVRNDRVVIYNAVCVYRLRCTSLRTIRRVSFEVCHRKRLPACIIL
jgi:hypothetical protein